MTGQQAVAAVYKYLMKADLGVKVFSNDKAPAYTGKYVVVNQLTFPQRMGLNTGYININISCPDIEGRADRKGIEEIADKIGPLFRDAFLDGAHFIYYSDSFAPDNDNTHYKNITLRVNYINL